MNYRKGESTFALKMNQCAIAPKRGGHILYSHVMAQHEYAKWMTYRSFYHDHIFAFLVIQLDSCEFASLA